MPDELSSPSERDTGASTSSGSPKTHAAHGRKAFLVKSCLLFASAMCFSLYIVWLLLPMEFLPLWMRSVGMLGTPLFVGDADDAAVINSVGFVGILLLAQWALLRPNRTITMLAKEKKGRPLWFAVIVAVGVTVLLSLAFVAVVPQVLGGFVPEYRRERLDAWGTLVGFCIAMSLLWTLWSVVFFAFRTYGYYPSYDSGVRRLLVTSAVVGFAAMLLCTAFLATLLEIPDWWKSIFSSLWPIWLGIAVLILWGFWTAVFFLYWKQGDHTTKMGRVIRLLVAGSFVELFVAIPVHAMAVHKRRNDCVCEHGSYTGLVFGFAVLLWAFGPGLVLLFMRENNRRQKLLERICLRCGSEFTGPEDEEKCPKCGKPAVS